MPGPEFEAAQVARDMEAIFGRVVTVRDPDIVDPSRAIKPIISHCSARENETLVPAGVVLAGALAISLVFAQPGTTAPSPRPIATVSSSVASAVPANRPPDLVDTPTDFGPRRRLAAASPIPAAEKSRPSPRPELHDPRQTFAQPIAVAPSQAEPVSQTGGSCDGLEGLDLAGCMRPEIRDADRKLRNAYYDAVRSGVDPRVLAAYRREWSRIRDEEVYDPQHAAASYRQMAEDLVDE